MKKIIFNFKNIFKKIISNKKLLYGMSIIVFVLLTMVLNLTYSALKSSSTNDTANIIVDDMKYSMKINGTTGTVITATSSTVTKSNIIITALNTKSSKYELIYHVCSDSSCTEYIDKPSNVSIEYSSRTTDDISGTIEASGAKSIRVIVDNESTTTYYIKMDINAGYVYNSLALKNMITDKYNEEDVTIAAYIEGTLSTTFPTTNEYNTTVTCTSNGGASNAVGTATWSSTKWVVNVTGVDTGQTVCNVYFTINSLKTKILGIGNSNVSSALTTPGQKVTLSTFDSLAESTLSVSSTTQAYYWTYGTGYTSNGDGTYNLTGVSTLLYSSNYSDLVGKYLVANSEYSCSSSTDTQKTSTNLTSVIKVTSATSSSLNYKQNYNPSDTGEAVLASTADDYGTSYYYRGSVENNYVVFANMCWRIVRVTGNNAIKLVLYNYNPNSVSNPCATSQDGTSYAFARYTGTTYTTTFNSIAPDNAYIGLMYATLSPIQSSSTSTKVMNVSGESSYYASSYTYNSSTGTFTLSGSMISGVWSSVGSSAVSTYPYTCKLSTSSGSCSILYKVSSYLNSTYGNVYRIIGSATTYALTHANTNKSTIVTNLETWYSTYLSSYSSYLADTIWCNDKSMSTASTYLGYGTNQTYYKAYQRLNTASTATPSLVCPNDASGGSLSKYTADETTYGNGALNYKIGLLTADEAAFAGITSSVSNTSDYLYKNATSDYWWVSSPAYYDATNFQSDQFIVQSYGRFSYNTVSTTYALRPSIALVSTTKVTGSGTSSDPYLVTGY